jgi:hypothetical protein
LQKKFCCSLEVYYDFSGNFAARWRRIRPG